MRQLHIGRIRRGAGLLLVFSCWFGHPAQAQSKRNVEMEAYSVSLPLGWYVQRDASMDRLWTCNKSNGDCTGSRGGLPLPGRVLITIMPVENHPEHRQYKNLESLMSSVHLRHSEPPQTVNLKLHDSATSSRCMLVRSLIGGDVWSDFYGWELGGKLFQAIVEYNDEPKENDPRRTIAVELLSSVRLRNTH